MKEKIKKIYENGTYALILLFILEIILIMFVTPNLYDDEWFIKQVTNEINPETNEVIEHTITGFVQKRYFTWSSRVIIEFILCLTLKTSKYLWILLEALMVTIVGYSISKIFVKDNKKANNSILISMILIYPYTIMHQAGWAATTINYMWPLAMCLFALIPIKKIWYNEKIKFFEYPLYTAALLFAGNHEQASSLLVCFYILFTIIMIIRDKKVKPYMIIQSALALGSIIFILTCPGNYIRQEEEMRRFIDFGMLTFLDKFVLGFTSTFGQIIANQNIVYTLLTSLLAIYVFSNYKEKLYRVISLVPVVSMLVFGHLSSITFEMFPNLEIFYELLTTKDVLLTVANCNKIYYTFPIIFTFANFICIGMSLLLLTKKYKNNIVFLIYLAGLASRVIMGFSPTVFVSKTRTMIFFDFAMIIMSFLIWQQLNNKKTKGINYINGIIKLTAVIQYINVLVYIYSEQKLY